MLSKKSVLPNFIRTIGIIAIASLSFTANAAHHEKDMKKAKSEHMQKAGDKMKDKMHGDKMKDKMHDDKMKDKMHGDHMEDKLSDKYKGDVEAAEDSMKDAMEKDQPE